MSENGRYRIPNDNPFVSTPGARKEIWAYGFRNPHRLNWAIDPANPANNRLIVNSVGMSTWETVYLVQKGANYGYARREGNELFKDDNQHGPLPADDRIPLQIGEQPTDKLLVPTYPVIQYGHDPAGGDSIGSGFLYNGKAIPSLRGKYIFTDLTTGRIWYTDYKDMLAADDGKAATLAPIREVKIRWNNPALADAGKTVYDDMYPVVETGYRARGGKSPTLQGPRELIKGGRADVRFSIDAERRAVSLQQERRHDQQGCRRDGFHRAAVDRRGLRIAAVRCAHHRHRSQRRLPVRGRRISIATASPTSSRWRAGSRNFAGTRIPGWEKHVLVNGISQPINAAAYDVDGDGIPEIALAHEFSNVYDAGASASSRS